MVRLPIPNAHESDRQALADMVTRATAIARERYVLHEKFRHRILTDLDDGTHKLNQKLTAWWDLDFRTFRTELGKAFKADIILRERSEWEGALTGWQSEHRSLTTCLVDLESAINDRVYHFFALTPAERKTLDDHMHNTMIDYPLGEV